MNIYKNILDFLEFIWKSLRLPKRKRIELRYVSYEEADKLIKEGWYIAKEENNNRCIGMAYVEKLEEESKFKK